MVGRAAAAPHKRRREAAAADAKQHQQHGEEALPAVKRSRRESTPIMREKRIVDLPREILKKIFFEFVDHNDHDALTLVRAEFRALVAEHRRECNTCVRRLGSLELAQSRSKFNSSLRCAPQPRLSNETEAEFMERLLQTKWIRFCATNIRSLSARFLRSAMMPNGRRSVASASMLRLAAVAHLWADQSLELIFSGALEAAQIIWTLRTLVAANADSVLLHRTMDEINVPPPPTNQRSLNHTLALLVKCRRVHLVLDGGFSIDAAPITDFLHHRRSSNSNNTGGGDDENDDSYMKELKIGYNSEWSEVVAKARKVSVFFFSLGQLLYTRRDSFLYRGELREFTDNHLTAGGGQILENYLDRALAYPPPSTWTNTRKILHPETSVVEFSH